MEQVGKAAETMMARYGVRFAVAVSVAVDDMQSRAITSAEGGALIVLAGRAAGHPDLMPSDDGLLAAITLTADHDPIDRVERFKRRLGAERGRCPECGARLDGEFGQCVTVGCDGGGQ